MPPVPSRPPAQEKMATRGKKVTVPDHLIPRTREEQREKREREQSKDGERKVAAAAAKRQKQNQAEVSFIASQRIQTDLARLQMQNMSIANILNASKRLGSSKNISGQVGVGQGNELANRTMTTSSTRQLPPPQSQPKIHRDLSKGSRSSAQQTISSLSLPTLPPAALLTQLFLPDGKSGGQSGDDDEASQSPNESDPGFEASPPPTHKPFPGRYPKSPTKSRTVRNNHSLSPLAQPNFGALPLDDDGEDMEAIFNVDGVGVVSDLEEMRAGSDTDFGGPPPGTDSEGFLLGDGGYGTCYNDEDDEMGDVRDGARDPHYNDNGETKDAEDAARAPRTRGERKSYVGLDEGSLSGHESDLYAPSHSASPMRVDKGGTEIESDAGDMSPDEAALLQQLAAIREAKKSKKSTSKSVAGSTNKKPPKDALRREIIAERSNPPPPHVAAPKSQRAKSGTTASKSDSKRKDIEGEGREEAESQKHSRTNEVGGINTNWQSWMLTATAPLKTKGKKGKEKPGKPRGHATPSTTDVGDITFKDVDVDLAAQGKVAKPKKNYTINNIPFANPQVDQKHFKEKFIPSIYNWAGSRAVSQPFSTTGHPELKATITDLWCNSVFKHLTPLDTNGTRRVDNAAVLAVTSKYLQTLRSEISKTARANTNVICDKLFTTKEEVAEWASHQLDKDRFLYLDFDNKDPKAAGAFLSPLVLVPFGYFCQCVRGAPKTYGLPYAGLALSAAAAMHSLFLRQEGVLEAGEDDNASNNNPNSFREDPWGKFSAGFFEQINKRFTIETWQAVITAAEPYMTKKKGKRVPKAVERGGKEKLTGVRPSLRM
ncbi:hypothetical protein CPB85DRAFT_1446502 [Mucidula mucida]|nr:hypothetical protein CPB85DRAFT_1446502 [Mucidula mucida]